MTQKSCLTCSHWTRTAPRPDVNWGTCSTVAKSTPNNSLVLLKPAEAIMFTRDVFYCAMFESKEVQEVLDRFQKTTGS